MVSGQTHACGVSIGYIAVSVIERGCEEFG